MYVCFHNNELSSCISAINVLAYLVTSGSDLMLYVLLIQPEMQLTVVALISVWPNTLVEIYVPSNLGSI